MRLLVAEFHKIKNTKILIVLLSLTLSWVGISVWHFYSLTYAAFLEAAYPPEDQNPWYAFYFGSGFMFLLAFLLPLVLSLVVFFFKNIEDKADGWKRLFLLPFSRFTLHVNKLSAIWVCSVAFIAILFLLFFVSGVLLSWFKPDFKFDQYPSYHYFLLCFGAKYCGFSLTLVNLCYLVLITVRRYALSLATVVLLPLIGPLMTDSKFNPFSYFINSLHDFLRARARYMSLHEFDAKREVYFSYPMFTLYDVINLLFVALTMTALYLISKRHSILYD